MIVNNDVSVIVQATNVVGYSQVLAQCARSMENWFFPSSEVTRVLKMELLQLKNFERACVHDVT